MRTFLSFLTVLFLITSLVIILFISLYDMQFFNVIIGEINRSVLAAGISILIFVILLSAGFATNSGRSFGTLFGNGFFHLAVLELFLFSAGALYYKYYMQQPGQIVIHLGDQRVKDRIKLIVNFHSGSLSTSDTVTAPVVLYSRPPGRYSFETIDKDIIPFHTDLTLRSRQIDTVMIPAVLSSRKLAIQTDPEGAEIWIDGSLESITPDTLEIFRNDSMILELKMAGFKTYSDTFLLHADTNLGIIPLLKFYTLRIYCEFSDIEYTVYDQDNNAVFAAAGTHATQVVKGTYRISYGIGEGQTESRTFRINNNATITIPF